MISDIETFYRTFSYIICNIRFDDQLSIIFAEIFARWNSYS